MRPSLPFAINQNATCPFESGACLFSDTEALEMDTGLLDSHEDFGINAAPQDRIQFRRVATCAPLHGKQYASYLNVNNSDSVLGPQLLVNAGPTPVNNYTFMYYTRTFLFQVDYALRYVALTLHNCLFADFSSAVYSMGIDKPPVPQ